MSEGRQQAQESRGAAQAGARFEPVPAARSRGRIELTSSRNAELAGLGAAAALAVVSAVVISASAIAPPLWVWLPLVMLAAAVWAHEGRTRRAELSWDEWGLTLDEAGARVAIAWSAARVHVERERHRTTVRVCDDEGRTITVYHGAPRGSSAAPRRAVDLSGLLAVTEALPTAGPRRAGAGAGRRALGVLVTIAVAALSLFFAQGGRPVVSAAALVVGVLSVRALHEAVSACSRARALRGARPMRVTGAPGEPLRSTVAGEAVILRVGETLADPRAGARDEPVLVALGPEAPPDASSPYRGARVVPVRALETLGERAMRRRQLASGLGRFATGIAAIACWGVLVPVAPGEPASGEPRPVSSLGPRPEPPRARPIAPRPADDRAEAERAVQAWRTSGPHFEHTYRCTGGRGCVQVPVYVDPRSGTRLVCDDEHVQECMRLSASGGLPLAPLPER